ncbi:MAG: UDP-N-acetylmuramate dehydrogenase [Litorilituus sp.]|jgi:UDP-N-acetylmuramate dehydrogenase|nr:UDP-N-acetylmuramate dehydrogenase [Litorilituus sp.]
MRSIQQCSMQGFNSFKVKAVTPTIYFPDSLADLHQLAADKVTSFYILGEGSNTLFIDQQAPVIIKPCFLGICVDELEDTYHVSVGAGENWHNLVNFCIAQGINGLENLALIPGSVGAAPVQNIGAYGVELSDFCYEVEYFDLHSKQLHRLSKEQCQFTYRGSIFKKSLHGRAIITKVVLSFPKQWQANLSYHGLDHLPFSATAKQVMDQVVKVRRQKLPDPATLPNAGSFFKNPVVSSTKAAQLKRDYPDIPSYPQADGNVKLAAGWLIEQAGLKGYTQNGVGVHENQALVLVSYQYNNGQEILNLAHYVQQKVLARFDVLLLPEVRLITKYGEKEFAELTSRTC